eukprot:10244-Alexandrium_andersonii.AAC.1
MSALHFRSPGRNTIASEIQLLQKNDVWRHPTGSISAADALLGSWRPLSSSCFVRGLIPAE